MKMTEQISDWLWRTDKIYLMLHISNAGSMLGNARRKMQLTKLHFKSAWKLKMMRVFCWNYLLLFFCLIANLISFQNNIKCKIRWRKNKSWIVNCKRKSPSSILPPPFSSPEKKKLMYNHLKINHYRKRITRMKRSEIRGRIVAGGTRWWKKEDAAEEKNPNL